MYDTEVVNILELFAERPELRHAGQNDVNREAELETPSRVACSELLGCFIWILKWEKEPPIPSVLAQLGI